MGIEFSDFHAVLVFFQRTVLSKLEVSIHCMAHFVNKGDQ
ncbi:Uncharacterised protein [Mycobacteroides abscessus subsp. abscessus]|nr:Uncharacterised protein [Mycobacteroides abscessus subsp. abscessus]